MTVFGTGTGTPIAPAPVVIAEQPYSGVLYTHVSLNHYAKIMGLNPAHFNGADQYQLPTGRIIYTLDNAQNNIWPQYSHQAYDQISRDELALEIFAAEQEIEEVLGYHIAPDWEDGDIYSMQDFHRPEYSGSVFVTMNGEFVFNIRRQKWLGAGVRSLTDLGTYAVVYSDEDGDGFDETATVIVDITSVVTDFDIVKVKFYYPGTNGEREYEVRPTKRRVQSGNTLTVQFDTTLMIDPIQQRIIGDNENTWIANLGNPAHLIGSLDVYYEDLDSTQWSCKFVKVDQSTLAEELTYGLATLRKYKPTTVGVVPATYSGGAWAKTFCSCSLMDFYDYMSLRYMSGESANTSINKAMGHNVREDLARAVCYLATARLPRIFYANNNATALAEHLREDLALNDQGQARFLTRDDAYNPFGTKYGEIMAWRLITKLVHMNVTGVAI